jgi:hypothetical protein
LSDGTYDADDQRDALAAKLLAFLNDEDTEAVLELLEQEGWGPARE